MKHGKRFFLEKINLVSVSTQDKLSLFHLIGLQRLGHKSLFLLLISAECKERVSAFLRFLNRRALRVAEKEAFSLKGSSIEMERVYESKKECPYDCKGCFNAASVSAFFMRVCQRPIVSI